MTPDGPSSAGPGRSVVDVLDGALARQTDAIVAGLVDVRAELRTGRRTTLALAAFVLVLALAYLGFGTTISLPGGVEIKTDPSSASAPVDDERPSFAGPDGAP